MKKWAGIWSHAVSRQSWDDRGKNGHSTQWYSGTWKIKGCPNCPCSIEYVSFKCEYDAVTGEWKNIRTDDLCPRCGTPLTEACLDADPRKKVLDATELHKKSRQAS